MIERTKKGYYHCKILHNDLYNDFVVANTKHNTAEMLAMLQHENSTQKNEAYNHAVGSLAPKTKTFSKSSSLLTRVHIVAATQIVGNHETWERIFFRFVMELDPNLSRHFRKKDETKGKRQIYQKTIAYKSYRSGNKHLKLADAHVKQLEEHKTGSMYKTGVAVKAAKQTIKRLENAIQ